MSPAYAPAASALDKIKRQLQLVDPLSLSTNLDKRRTVAYQKAWTYVWLSAVLERHIKFLLEFVFQELDTAGVTYADLRHGILSMLLDSDFNRVASSGAGLNTKWGARASILVAHSSSTPVQFANFAKPLDGRTIRARHYELLWLLFELPQPYLPSIRHRLLLEDLADGRNEIAHGRVEPDDFGRRKTVNDLLRLVSDIEDLIEHIELNFETYLAAADYIRSP